MQQEVDQNIAEEVALQALTFIAADDDIFERFLQISGATAENLRSSLQNRFFLAGVLEFLLSQELLLLDFCGQQKIDPRFPVMAQAILSGSDRDMTFI